MSKKNNQPYSTRNPNPVDIYLGERLKQRRVLLGLSQVQIAETLGITFQQVQKYEMAANRITVARLVDFSNILDVPISYFFDDMPKPLSMQPKRLNNNLQSPAQQPIKDNIMVKNETLTLLRHFYGIKKKRKRQSIINLCKSIAK